MYLFQISRKYITKNKLETAVLAHIVKFERVYFYDRNEVFEFADCLKRDIDNFCKSHSRCKPISLSVSDPKDNEHYKHKFDDISISISELFWGYFLEGKEGTDGSVR